MNDHKGSAWIIGMKILAWIIFGFIIIGGAVTAFQFQYDRI